MAILRFGPYELDDKHGDLHRDGRPVEIQALPLRLLIYLAQNPGELLSRDELLEHVWGSAVVSENAISTALKHVRHVLGDRERSPPWVETLRGRGVRFNAPVQRRELELPTPGVPQPATGPLRRWLFVSVSVSLILSLSVALGIWLSWPAPLGLLLDATNPKAPSADPPLPRKPSIVVLPFTNMSPDGEYDYFCDGLTEDLTTDLARNPTLFVISRNSAFTYKDTPTDIRRVGRELGVAYAVEGSVRRIDDRVRITAQLLDTRTGGHIWSQRYDRRLQDIFALQSQISEALHHAMRSEIQGVEARRRWRREARDIRAYDELLRADAYIQTMRRHAIVVEARRHLERAIELDPGYSTAHARLAASYWMEYGVGWSTDRTLLDRAEALARRAIELAPDSGDGYEPLSSILILRGRLPEALEAANRAAEANPNIAVSQLVRAPALAFSGRFLESFQALQAARRLDPRSTDHQGPLCLGESARRTCRARHRALRRGPPDLPGSRDSPGQPRGLLRGPRSPGGGSPPGRRDPRGGPGIRCVLGGAAGQPQDHRRRTHDARQGRARGLSDSGGDESR